MPKFVFINRKEELKRLEYGLRRLNSFVLIAPRRFGKTALAKRVLEEIRKDNGYLVIEIDLMRYLGSEIKRIAEGIIENCLNSIGLIGHLRLMLKQVELSISLKLRYKELELEPVIHLFKDGQQEDYWKLLEVALELPNRIARKEKKKVVVFFDEFSELANMDENTLKVFRSVIQLHENVGYIFAGSQESLMSKIFVDKAAAFYRFGEILHLEELSNEDVYKYFLDHFKSIPFDVLSEVIELTKCHPYYVSLIIEHFEYCDEYYRDLNLFYSFINNILITQEHAYIELQLLKIIEKKHAMEALRVLAMGLNPYEELDISTQQISQVLSNLEFSGYVRKVSRAIYVLTDPLIKYYLSRC